MSSAITCLVVLLAQGPDPATLEKLPKEKLVSYLVGLNQENASRVVAGRGSVTRTYEQSESFLRRQKLQIEGLARSSAPETRLNFDPRPQTTVSIRVAFAPDYLKVDYIGREALIETPEMKIRRHPKSNAPSYVNVTISPANESKGWDQVYRLHPRDYGITIAGARLGEILATDGLTVDRVEYVQVDGERLPQLVLLGGKATPSAESRIVVDWHRSGLIRRCEYRDSARVEWVIENVPRQYGKVWFLESTTREDYFPEDHGQVTARNTIRFGDDFVVDDRIDTAEFTLASIGVKVGERVLDRRPSPAVVYTIDEKNFADQLGKAESTGRKSP